MHSPSKTNHKHSDKSSQDLILSDGGSSSVDISMKKSPFYYTNSRLDVLKMRTSDSNQSSDTNIFSPNRGSRPVTFLKSISKEFFLDEVSSKNLILEKVNEDGFQESDFSVSDSIERDIKTITREKTNSRPSDPMIISRFLFDKKKIKLKIILRCTQEKSEGKNNGLKERSAYNQEKVETYYGNDFTEEKEEQTIIKENKILQNLKDKNNAILLEKSSESLNYSRKYGKDGEVSPYPTEKQLEILMQSGFNSSLALKSNYNSFIKHSERVFSVTEDRKCCLYCNLI